MKNKLLFVCLGNIARSPTAEEITSLLIKQKGLEYSVDSAGLDAKFGEKKVNKELLEESFKIFVMEDYMKKELVEKYGVSCEKIINLDIKDNYCYMQDELIEIFSKKFQPYFKELEEFKTK
ncbi:MAG: phosphotyrosine protein phosphatase [Candidatus Nanoarchaeia archaeon]